MLNEAVGICQLKALLRSEPGGSYGLRSCNCTDEIRWGQHRTRRGWCAHVLSPLPALKHRQRFKHRPGVLASRQPPCSHGRDIEASNVTLLSSSVEWLASSIWRGKNALSRKRLRHTTAPRLQRGATVYLEAVGNGQLAVLGGGLNNMLMGLAQLLTDTCEHADTVLVLPSFDADPLRDSNFWLLQKLCPVNLSSAHTCTWIDRPDPDLAAFVDIFDLHRFEVRLWRALCTTEQPAWCSSRSRFVSAALPPGAHVELLTLRPLRPDWNFSRYGRMLSAVYRAVKPSAIVRALVEALVNEARPRIGLHWAAVHLPIEKDWWWGNDWCHARKPEKFTRRCYAPSEVARLTHYARQNASGTVLLYAFDKAARRDNPTWSGNRAAYGPPVCRDDFGEATFKLQLPPVVPYTFRNAAELFFAAQAPAGFFGNAFSTFSKAVALMRSSTRTALETADGGSFAYDCARLEFEHWKDGARTGISTSHPGFWHLMAISNGTRGAGSDHCGTAFNSPEVLATSEVRVVASEYARRKAAERRAFLRIAATDDSRTSSPALTLTQKMAYFFRARPEL